MGDATGPYGVNVLQRLAFNAAKIQEAANLLNALGFNVSTIALVGAVAEEMADSLGSPPWERLGDWGFDLRARFPTNITHNELVDFYHIYSEDRAHYDQLQGIEKIIQKFE